MSYPVELIGFEQPNTVGSPQVVLVGSSINERDQMLFISTDEGSSFQRQSIAFTPDTIIFHPKEEDKLLAYCKEGRIFASTDLGRKWTLLQERVTKDRVFWSVSGVDVDPDLVHMEMQDTSGGTVMFLVIYLLTLFGPKST
ncbi:unnamed protein product [Pleuronectes platessa]|uniref:Sortilin N-terminal domain-containing protein n=1 Tax=Pleuronectes platessa TaxID=8262 RepID=A0A9N7Z9V3_PLEPL|nr:unnamed protein product [Pleuronectes platessa]